MHAQIDTGERGLVPEPTHGYNSATGVKGSAVIPSAMEIAIQPLEARQTALEEENRNLQGMNQRDPRESEAEKAGIRKNEKKDRYWQNYCSTAAQMCATIEGLCSEGLQSALAQNGSFLIYRTDCDILRMWRVVRTACLIGTSADTGVAQQVKLEEKMKTFILKESGKVQLDKYNELWRQTTATYADHGKIVVWYNTI